MHYVVAIVPVVPIRLEPSHRSEQVSQLLFGETAQVLLTNGDFSKVKCEYDAYEGWCQTSQLAKISSEQANMQHHLLAGEWQQEIMVNNTSMNIPFGSSLSLFQHNRFSCENYIASHELQAVNTSNGIYSKENIEGFANMYLNTSYQWGGRSVFGVDCSGFCQVVFRFMNIRLKRDASQQAEQGENIGFLQEGLCGDLAFFNNEQGKITHVGILLSQQSIIHASGKVRIDKIDNVGIINSDTGLRTHNLRLIKRMANYT